MDTTFIDEQHQRLDRILEREAPHELAHQAGWSLTRRMEWFRDEGLIDRYDPAVLRHLEGANV